MTGYVYGQRDCKIRCITTVNTLRARWPDRWSGRRAGAAEGDKGPADKLEQVQDSAGPVSAVCV
jgi:hypothetical protein